MRQYHREIKRICIGTEKILNTNWPVESFLERIQEGRKVYWQVTWNLTNGIPTGSTRFRTKAEALEALERRNDT